ncbi:MAG: hypothetical protein GWN00_01045 [Aliifodinibius sp.]|nr:hypothetical protein [Fodinibius sp.]NIV09917.1 hypothetical protein [Fodinibius sp.]NIY23447.1 hypothetical protein [Fodinibius sp.]
MPSLRMKIGVLSVAVKMASFFGGVVRDTKPGTMNHYVITKLAEAGWLNPHEDGGFRSSIIGAGNLAALGGLVTLIMVNKEGYVSTEELTRKTKFTLEMITRTLESGDVPTSSEDNYLWRAELKEHWRNNGIIVELMEGEGYSLTELGRANLSFTKELIEWMLDADSEEG